VDSDTNVFRRVTVESLYHPSASKQVLVVWELISDHCLQLPLTFTLEFAKASNASTWTQVARTVDQMFLFDKAPEATPVDFSRFYRVIVEDAAGTKHTSHACNFFMNLDHYQWRLFRQYTRTQLLGLNKRGGVAAWLLKRKTSGPKCTACVDPNTGYAVSTECGSCYGTGFVGGYHPPLPYPVFAQPDQRRTRLSENGLLTAVLRTSQVLAYGAPEPNDIIVYAKTLAYYRITGDLATTVEYGGVPMTYTVQLDQIPSTSSASRVPVPRWEQV
jgi:hypothetical protein